MRRLLIKGAFLIALLAALVKAYEKYVFPRDPARTIDPSVTVVSPADGRLVYVVPVEDGSVPISMKGNTRIPLHDIVKGVNRPEAGVLIGIFMSPFDVHYQRSPISGIVGRSRTTTRRTTTSWAACSCETSSG